MSDIKTDVQKAASDAQQSALHAENRFLGMLAHNWYYVFVAGAVLGFIVGHFV